MSKTDERAITLSVDDALDLIEKQAARRAAEKQAADIAAVEAQRQQMLIKGLSPGQAKFALGLNLPK